MDDTDYKVNRKRIQRYMREMGIRVLYILHVNIRCDFYARQTPFILIFCFSGTLPHPPNKIASIPKDAGIDC